ncbi:MAG: hypothetical protein GXP05_08180 [Alphaproteobacteria bacterium]|nr:hypothetical protein [Alphaproteobacteria bacterium]
MTRGVTTEFIGLGVLALRILSVVFLSFAGLVFSWSATFAADVALVLGNRNYQRASWMYDAPRVLNTASALRRAGYAVVSGRDLSAEQTRQAMERYLLRLPEAERTVIVLAGHFVYSERDTWFVPVEADRPDLGNIGYMGISIGALMDIAAQKTGGAAIFLATVSRPIDLGLGLKSGIGALNVPQGVFVATGNPVDIDLTIRRDFLAQGVGVAAALAQAPASVKGQGFISDLTALSPAADTGFGGADDGYWQAVQDLNSEIAMRAYLDAFPRGNHVVEAQNWLDGQVRLTPLEQAKADEDQLRLSRDERRAIQQSLSLLGYDTHGIDGIFGRGTRAAIRNWQAAFGANPTGFLLDSQITRIGRQAETKTAQLAEEARKKQRALEIADRAYWQASGAASGDERGLRRYLFRYPDGLFADVADARLTAIEQARLNTVSALERQSWDDARSQNTIASYQGYLDAFPNGSFADEAKARLKVLQKQAAKQAEIDAAKQAEADLRLNGLGRILVEQQLLSLGFKAGPPDGNFDKKTRRAIRKFQKTRGFPVTGYLNRQTVIRLIAEAN